MSYSDFTLKDIKLRFGIENQRSSFLKNPVGLEPGSYLKEALEKAKKLSVKSEKARSELLVMPILIDLMERNNDFFTIYSGETLIADKEKGLVGECDFLLGKNNQSFDISAPLFSIVEAKKNDIEAGIPQCGAQLIGARLFNKEVGNEPLEEIYGCVTTGEDWQFLKLQKDHLFIETRKFYLVELDLLLGCFQQIIDLYK